MATLPTVNPEAPCADVKAVPDVSVTSPMNRRTSWRFLPLAGSLRPRAIRPARTQELADT